MQSSPPIPHTWQEFIWLSLAAILASGGTWLFPKLRRKQSQADIHKTDAETRQIDLSAATNAGDLMLQLMKQAAQAMADVERLRAQKEFWQARAEAVITERDDFKTRNDLQEMELNMRDKDIKRLKGALDARGIKLSDFDEPRA